MEPARLHPLNPSAKAPLPAARQAPNILWILTTQWRAQATGYAGDPNARTPHLDALAGRATDFAQAVTPHPFGPFARAALLTGRPSPDNGVREYFDPLRPEQETVAGCLRARGYATAFFGKWHLYRRDPAAALVGPAHARIVVPPDWRGGFEFWEGFESGFLLNDPWLHGTRLPDPVQFAGYQSDVVCGRAGDWLAGTAHRDPRPWFCVVSLEPPHPPYAAPAAGVPRRDPRGIDLPANVPRGGEAERRAREELAGYYAHLEATDRAIGRMLAQVPSAGSIVVFTSVHGDMLGAHGLFRKGWPHEESVRVPLLVSGAHLDGSGAWVLDPQSGTTRGDPVSLIELPRWTRLWTRPGRRDPEPRSEVQRISMPSVVRLPRQCDRAWRGVRTAGRKLVLDEQGAPWLFFHLDRDPGETNNLAGDPAHAAECRCWAARC